jgi:hypothetical protein
MTPPVFNADIGSAFTPDTASARLNRTGAFFGSAPANSVSPRQTVNACNPIDPRHSFALVDVKRHDGFCGTQVDQAGIPSSKKSRMEYLSKALIDSLQSQLHTQP